MPPLIASVGGRWMAAPARTPRPHPRSARGRRWLGNSFDACSSRSSAMMARSVCVDWVQLWTTADNPGGHHAFRRTVRLHSDGSLDRDCLLQAGLELRGSDSGLVLVENRSGWYIDRLQRH